MNDLQRLTIIVADNAVYLNSKGYCDLDLTSCGIPPDVWALQWEEGEGWIEFRGSQQNEPITGTDFPEWVNKCIQKYEEFDYLYHNPPAPTPDEWAEYNDVQAKYLLEQSDWAALPDVNLLNQAEWDSYRAALRAITINPPHEEINPWPVKPQAIWA